MKKKKTNKIASISKDNTLFIENKSDTEDSKLDQYYPFHKKKLRDSYLIDSNYISLKKSATLKDAAILFLKFNLSAVPIVDEMNKFLGMISSNAIIRASLSGSPLNEPITAHYEDNINTFNVNDLVQDTITFLRSPNPVIDDSNSLIGLVKPESILKYFIKSIEGREKLEYEVEWLSVCFDMVYEGIVLVDQKGIICMYNETYSQLVGIEKEKMIGKPINEVVLNTGMLRVLKTGIPERNYAHNLNGQEMIVHRIPLWKNNRIYGAIGVLVFLGLAKDYKIYNPIRIQKDNTHDRFFLFGKLKQEKNEIITFDHIIGETSLIAKAKKIACQVAKKSATILINGESGVGKELFAKAIHNSSGNREGKFISINCASIPENLLESELFGYVGGAFTGSKRSGKPGKFELADQGTIFLDEIGDMPVNLQVKILRVLQERRVERLGGTSSISLDFRIIAATNCNLEAMVKEKKFREDLFYRLNVISIVVPPLREMKTDIPLLISYYLKKICEEYGSPEKKIDEEAMIAMMNYSWPGNVRELANVIERLVALVERQDIYLFDLPPYFIKCNLNDMIDNSKYSSNFHQQPQQNSVIAMSKELSIEREKRLIVQALIEEGGNKSRTANKIGVSRATLYKKMLEFKIN